MTILSVQTVRSGLSAFLLAGALTACGPEQTQSGPAFFTGSIVVSPPSFTVTVGTDMAVPPSTTPCTDPANFVGTPIFPFLISVFDERGQPVGNADIDIVLGLADNTLGGFVALIDGDTGDIVSDVGDPVPYSTTTDNSGNKQMFIAFYVALGCEYAAAMTVTSGSLVTQMDFDATP